ncbi:MAG: CPBP family intramembrane metalloprotease [Clostridium sp.]|nr:CPBP family intramembrane metalloprotease [Clostridium sp.]
MNVEEKKENRKQIIIFLAVTFLLTYGMEIFVIMPMVGSSDVSRAYAAQSMISGMMAFPAIGVLITLLITKDRLFRNLRISFNLKGNLKYYGLVWFGFALLIFLGMALYFVIFPRQFDGELGYVKVVLAAQAEIAGAEDTTVTTGQARSLMANQIVMGVLLSPLLNLLPCLGEEWGWRGYLLPRLMKQFKVVPALLINGVIWGLWHAPLTVMGHNYGVGYLGYPVTGILAMCAFCTVIGIILSYVTIKVKSCLPAVVGHGMLNGLGSVGIYFTSLQNPYNIFLGPACVGLIGGAGFIALAAVLLYRLYKEEKEGGAEGAHVVEEMQQFGQG